MRKLFYLAAVFSLFAFIYSAVHVSKQLSNGPLMGLGAAKGLESATNTSESDALEDKFNEKIKAAADVANHDGQLYFWVSILVTGLTAASTLVSGIQAARKDTPDQRRAQTFAVVIAVLTFCSTMASTFSNHLNEVKTADTKTVTDLTTLREQFFTDYNKAADADKHTVVVTYKRKLG